MNSQAVNDELAELSGLPVYKVAEMMTHLARLILTETKRGGSVSIPRVGAFRGKSQAAKSMGGIIISKADGVITRGTRRRGARRVLKFTPLKSTRTL